MNSTFYFILFTYLTVFLLLDFFSGFHFHLLLFYAMQYEHAIKITLFKSGKYKLSLTGSGHKTILQTHTHSQKEQLLQRCMQYIGVYVCLCEICSGQNSFPKNRCSLFSSWKSKKNTTLLPQKKKSETVMNNIIINKNYKFVVVNISWHYHSILSWLMVVILVWRIHTTRSRVFFFISYAPRISSLSLSV